MGGTTGKDLAPFIERTYDETFGTASITRAQLPALIEKLIQGSELPPSKAQYITICDASLTSSAITKQDLLSLYESVKTNNLELEALKKQIEFYLSDSNLRHDKFFHNIVSASQGGYISVDTLLNCKRLQTLNATPDRISEAVRTSSEVEMHPENVGVRRVNNRPPPVLKIKHKKEDPPEPSVLILRITIEEENKVTWKEIRDAFKGKYTDVDLMYTRYSGNEGHFGISGKTSSEVIDSILNTPFEVAGHSATVSKIEGEELLEFWKNNGGHFEMCNSSLKKRKLEKGKKALKIGGKAFASVTKLKTYLKALLNATPEGQIVDPQYFNLLEAVLKLHPHYEEKSRGLKSFEVGIHPSHAESKCFFIVREDGSKEDFSMTKCVAQL